MNLIIYTTQLTNLEEVQIEGFFAGWQNKPTNQTLLQILSNASYKVVAIDKNAKKMVGFIYAISDNTISAYIPLLEVLPEYQKKGIGKELIVRILDMLKDFYMIDLSCDANLVTYYEKFHFQKGISMLKRNYNILKQI